MHGFCALVNTGAGSLWRDQNFAVPFRVGQVVERRPNPVETDFTGDHRGDVDIPSAIARSDSANSFGS